MSEVESVHALLWGIDGGGTKTTVMLAESVPGGTPGVLASVRAGSSNVNSRPWSEITAELDEAFLSARQVAGRLTDRATALVAAFAGVGSPQVRRRWEEWFASRNFARKVRLVDDGEPLIAAGLAEGWGVVLIAGTGSSAFGRSRTGESARAGGWGYLFGDEGSGFDIGRKALREMTHAFDLRKDQTSWMRTVSTKWTLANPRDLVDRVYRADEPRQRVASVAPIICEAADRGDSDAQRFLTDAADQLASLVEKVAEALGFVGQPFPLALSGGVIANCRYLQRGLVSDLTNRGLYPEPVAVVSEPAQGCIALAERVARE